MPEALRRAREDLAAGRRAEPEPGAVPPPPQRSTIPDKLMLVGCLASVVAVGVFAVIGLAATLGWL